ncbi:uncharacterized protein LDX57_004859 [Aspergillus melleus]|uniref:uncharacterized protein n=1 Tax=Aspergillus melleus TaxID=138277 RepID=UPI001E8E20CD|nr:uncharacterized protein LDX57_004859 [Aspergillus melleus]KAH8427142.1 hypothetical protein LDX57_004859 [Aspergillus melleus]
MAALRAEDIIKSTIPDLKLGQWHTEHSAIHNLRYLGELRPWRTFAAEAWRHSRDTDWAAHPDVLAHGPWGPVPAHSLFNEHVWVGDETGVQGRFTNNIGQAVSAACRVFGLDIAFADFRASNAVMGGWVPDSGCITAAGELRGVGEDKVGWVPAHSLTDAVEEGGRYLRKVVGQIARYLRLGQVRYGFLTTYDETIFLRQVKSRGGVWRLEYSEPIRHDARAGQNSGEITLREAFWYFAAKAAGAGFQTDIDVKMENWVR